MNEFAVKHAYDDDVSVYFDIEADKVMAIGEKMAAINEEAYMNGYNWEAFLNHYLHIYHPALLNGLDTDSEAGTYVAVYNKVDEGKADKLIAIINELVAEPEKIYHFLREKGEEIQWD